MKVPAESKPDPVLASNKNIENEPMQRSGPVARMGGTGGTM
jgi:hypothetical protein